MYLLWYLIYLLSKSIFNINVLLVFLIVLNFLRKEILIGIK